MPQCNGHRPAAGQAKPKRLTCCSHRTRTGWGREAAGGGARRLSRCGPRRTVRAGGSPPGFLWMGGCGTFSSLAFQRREEQPPPLRGLKQLRNWCLGRNHLWRLFWLLHGNNLRGVLFHFVAAVFIFKNNQSCLWCMEFFNVYPHSSQAHSQCG